MFITDLIEIQNSVVGNAEWSKFGSKIGDPFLSILPEDVKKAISEINYQVGRAYNFQDEKFQYRIDVEDLNGSQKFNFFIKSKEPITVKKTENKKTVIPQKNNDGMYLLIASIMIAIVEFLALINFGLLKALWG